MLNSQFFNHLVLNSRPQTWERMPLGEGVTIRSAASPRWYQFIRRFDKDPLCVRPHVVFIGTGPASFQCLLRVRWRRLCVHIVLVGCKPMFHHCMSQRESPVAQSRSSRALDPVTAFSCFLLSWVAGGCIFACSSRRVGRPRFSWAETPLSVFPCHRGGPIDRQGEPQYLRVWRGT